MKKSRQDINHLILLELMSYNNKSKDLRFNQILVNVGISQNNLDKNAGLVSNELRYFEESQITFDRMIQLKKEFNGKNKSCIKTKKNSRKKE